jgi:hypothetical protein
MAFDRQDLENVITRALELLNKGDVDAAKNLLADTDNEVNRLYDEDTFYRKSGTH